jgi:glutathione S-transferase
LDGLGQRPHDGAAARSGHALRPPAGSRSRDVACRRIDELFALLDRQLANTRFLAGDRFTMGDIPAAIHKRRWDVFARGGRRFANVQRWYAEVAARPAFRKYGWSRPHITTPVDRLRRLT